MARSWRRFGTTPSAWWGCVGISQRSIGCILKTVVRVLGLYPINPDRLSSQCHIGATRYS